MCDEAMDNIELISGKGGGHYGEKDKDVPAVRTHFWSQPTICERTSYLAKMGISRMKWKCVPGEHHHVSETCRSSIVLFFRGREGETTAYQPERSSRRYVHSKEKALTQTSCAQNQGSKDNPADKTLVLYHTSAAIPPPLRHHRLIPTRYPPHKNYGGRRRE
jgi:hypothetical protein